LIVFDYSDLIEEFKVPDRFGDIVKEIGHSEGKKLGEICFIFVSRKKILEINRNFLKHDYVTDVITFNYNVKRTVSGDIYICKEKVYENAEEMQIPKKEEIMRVMIHGLLHLVGYNDNSRENAGLMRHKEDYYLNIIRGRII